MERLHCRRPLRRWGYGCLLLWMIHVCAGMARAGPPAPAPEPLPNVLTVESAVEWALLNNPALRTQRQQRGIAGAAVVIARTYPFNPEFQNQIQYVNGPPEAGTTYHFPFQSAILWQVQVRGQRGYRQQEAWAALSRTDWEIASVEQSLAVHVVRSFRTLLYRYEKLRLIEQIIQINEQALQQVRKLMEQGKLRGSDLILVSTEVDAARALLGPGRAALIAARFDLRRALGAVEETFEATGTLDPPLQACDTETLMMVALDRRADLRASRVAVEEAEARLRLTIADRFGDPSIGPVVNMDNTRDYYTGALINLPLPVFNRKQGEILQRRAEVSKALEASRQVEVDVRQDVQAALARLNNARNWANLYRTQTLPNLQSNMEGIEKLFLAGEPGVDVLRVIEVRRRLLQARDGYLDARSEVTQGEADLAAAVGEPMLAIVPCTMPTNSPDPTPKP